ncbi:YheC/YheD family protein [Mesobacillus zeae]|uniref:YheC/YheD family protein n=1 Tax=Mesobacillus zeae TaxID=1917180 RepID=A0A398B4Z8_9BACI|nr:YheC/YheD family protein [Mesobacillus zeae]RID84641.1 YheC/YheD family protein [Mesobacillus zeae]
MNAFGILSLNPGSEMHYFTEIAVRAAKYGMECFRFIPSGIDPVTHQVTGEKYEHHQQRWTQAQFPLPNILYDRCLYGDDNHSRRCMSIMKWLKSREDLLFLGHGLPGKWVLYKVLAASALAPYVPETKQAHTVYSVLSFLSSKKKIILKPVFGHAGSGIVCLEEEGETITVCAETRERLLKSIFPDRNTAENWIEKHIISRPYLMQEFLVLTDRQNRPMDIRIFLQKDENGSWKERGRGIRAGQANRILSNLAAGGSIEEYSSWEAGLPPVSREFISAELEGLTSALPTILESHFLPLFEIGIDIGIAADSALWILDVNSKPGRKVLEETSPEIKDLLYSAPLAYGILLAEQSQGKENYNEKTLSNRG